MGYTGDIGENKSIGKFIFFFCLMSLSVFINKKAKFGDYCILELFKKKKYIMPELIIHFILYVAFVIFLDTTSVFSNY